MFDFFAHRMGSLTGGVLLSLLLPLSSVAVKRTAPHAAGHAAASRQAAGKHARPALHGHAQLVRHGHAAGVSARGKGAASRNVVLLVRGRHGRMVRARYVEHFSAPSFALSSENTTMGDLVAGEDPLVRASLLEALGSYNGTALAIDPKNGRVLSMVNQKLALAGCGGPARPSS